MHAVGRLGSYITRGVYTVSGPFHPFGGAVDIIVVEQPDGSFKSSPWYVRFGKFQGVLKAREQLVTITVNGIETIIHMYLDPRGEAYFLRELEGEEGESVSCRSSSYEMDEQFRKDRRPMKSKSCNCDGSNSNSGDQINASNGNILAWNNSYRSSSYEMDEQSQKNRSPMKSKSCNCDGSNSNSGDQINASNGNILAWNNSRQSRISGLVLEQRSIKDGGYLEGGDGAGMVSINSLEHVEIAANLIEKFMLNESFLEEKLEISEISRKIDKPSLQDADEDIDASCSDSDIEDTFEAFPGVKLDEKQASDEKDVLPGFHVSEEVLVEISEISRKTDEPCLQNADHDNDAEDLIPEVTCSDSEIADVFQAFPSEKLDEKHSSVERDVELPGFHISEEESESSRVQSFIHCEISESSTEVLEGSKEQPEIADVFEACPRERSGEKMAPDERDVVLPGFGVSEKESGFGSIQSFIPFETSKSSTVLDGSKEQSEITDVFEACSGVSVEESGLSSIQSSMHCETSESSVVVLDGSKEQSESAGVFEACPDKKLGEKQASDERDVVLPGFGVSEEENGFSRVQSFIRCETSESSILGLDGLKGESEETLSLASGRPREIHFRAEILHVTTESLAEDTVNQQAENIELEGEDVESRGGYSQQMNPSSTSMRGHDETNLEASLTVSTSYAQTAYVDTVLGSVEVESKTIRFNTSFGNSVNTLQDEIDIGDKITRNELRLSLDSVGDLELLNGDYAPIKAAPIPVSESSEEEQFYFSDIDDFELREIQGESNFPDTVDEESNFPDAADEDNHPSICSEGIEILNGSPYTNDASYSFPDNFVQKNRLGDFKHFTDNLKLTSSPIDISNRHSVVSVEDGRLTESLPDLWSHMDNLGTEDLHHPLSHSLDLNSESLEWELHDKNESQYAKSDTCNESQSAQEYSNQENTHQLEDIENGVGNPAAGDPSKVMVTTGGSWSLWPFPFRRSRSRKTMQPTVNDIRISGGENVSDSNICTDDKKHVLQRKASKKIVKAMTPTSKELASLNLKEGTNAVTFTFSTAMLGRQKVDARIYLWKWNTRIVISDVDGTITKSDVLGQFMPLVGVDWSQTGVAHLFSAIKENGYQFLYLSARAIAQAYITRQFLVNLKQDGKALPDGPVVISPDGLFPSLFREVIRRAPHEFKIACLEDIRALFPSDCNPFYAGFGNRDTDEISYLKVGIPRGKIFIINPKGEVAVNRLVDTRSYTSLHALVHGMFPVMTSTEQEDFNSWNFWKLPPPEI